MTEYRPVRLSPELFDALAFRADDGRALTFQWGEPDADGFYVPTITVTEDAWFLETSRLRERNADLDRRLDEAQLIIERMVTRDIPALDERNAALTEALQMVIGRHPIVRDCTKDECVYVRALLAEPAPTEDEQ